MNYRLFIVAIVLVPLSCDHFKTKKAVPSVKVDAIKDKANVRSKRQADSLLFIEDSVLLEKSLADALNMARQKGDKPCFTDSSAAMTPDSQHTVGTTVNQGYYFSKILPHLIIRRKGPVETNIDVFVKTKAQYEKVVSYQQATMAYINDTIFDINGDGRKDFVVNWYGTNGCCLKAFSDVFLLRANKKSFSEDFEFTNPTFSPKEGIVRGVCYGHPGETEMYTYKWRGERLDTLEYIYYEKDKEDKKTGRFVISNRLPHSYHFKVLKIVKRMPAGYKGIEGYDWFTGKF